MVLTIKPEIRTYDYKERVITMHFYIANKLNDLLNKNLHSAGAKLIHCRNSIL